MCELGEEATILWRLLPTVGRCEIYRSFQRSLENHLLHCCSCDMVGTSPGFLRMTAASPQGPEQQCASLRRAQAAGRLPDRRPGPDLPQLRADPHPAARPSFLGHAERLPGSWRVLTSTDCRRGQESERGGRGRRCESDAEFLY